MESFGSMMALIGSILGIIVLVTSISLFVIGSFNKARIQALREDNQDLRSRVDDLDTELERAKQRNDVLDEKYNALKNENVMLANMITQRAEVEILADLLNRHHEEAVRTWARIFSLLEDGTK